VKAGNYDRALKVCAAQPNGALPRIVRAALENRSLGVGAVTAAIEEAMADVSPLVTKRAGVLWGVANLATLIGLIGTVFGLIESFKAQAVAAPEQKAALLTAGIAHAMNNTAFGLSIAVTCILAHIVLGIMVKNIIESLEHGGVRIENVLARKKASGDAPAPAAAQA
jgi:biopolymer transport protein ExbB/TolQ